MLDNAWGIGFMEGGSESCKQALMYFDLGLCYNLNAAVYARKKLRKILISPKVKAHMLFRVLRNKDSVYTDTAERDPSFFCHCS